MVFNSFDFIMFFILTSVIYFIVPQKIKWIVLLISSFIFYMAWRPELVLLMLFSIAANYGFSRKIYSSSEKSKKKYLAVCLVINFGLLFIFKYLSFAADTAAYICNLLGAAYKAREFDIILPMGISFYTFQASAYTIDVYRGDIKPERNFARFALFITFFPQLVAGPIERTVNLLPQLYEKHRFELKRVAYGVQIMLYGFFKKVVIADRTAAAVNTIYNNAGNYRGMYLVLATLLFTFQIYCDFSGYSDIAKGAAKVLGFDLTDNFRSPYLSKSIKEFWRRWHISLSTWFMDYVYIPLGGNRKGKTRTVINLFATFLISGLWHGANWTFVLWGAFHGVLMAFGKLTEKYRNGLKTSMHLNDNFVFGFVRLIITFALVSFGWIFFRANTITDAFYITGNLFKDIGSWTSMQYLYNAAVGMGVNICELFIITVMILLLIVLELISGKEQVFDYFHRKPFLVSTAFTALMAVCIILTGVFYNAGEFIYFQF